MHKTGSKARTNVKNKKLHNSGKKSRKMKWCRLGRAKLETTLPMETHENQLFTGQVSSQTVWSEQDPGVSRQLWHHKHTNSVQE